MWGPFYWHLIKDGACSALASQVKIFFHVQVQQRSHIMCVSSSAWDSVKMHKLFYCYYQCPRFWKQLDLLFCIFSLLLLLGKRGARHKLLSPTRGMWCDNKDAGAETLAVVSSSSSWGLPALQALSALQVRCRQNVLKVIRFSSLFSLHWQWNARNHTVL